MKLRGEPYVLWRAVDEQGTELDVLLQRRRDKAVAMRLFTKVLRIPCAPKTVTNQLRSYPAEKTEVPELAGVKHVFVKCLGPGKQPRGEQPSTHQPTCRRERPMQEFRDPRRTLAFLSHFGPIRQHFALPRHRENRSATSQGLRLTT